MDAVSCLMRYPWRTLAALGKVYDVRAYHHLPQDGVARSLSKAIHAQLPHTLERLSADARAALLALTQAEDHTMERSDFIARFGALHPHRPWNPDAPPGPWPTPQTPASELVHCGLAYPLNLGTSERPIPVVLLPDDLHAPVVAALDLPPRPAAQPADALEHLPTYRLPSLQADTFTFLSFLNRRDYTVTHGRWLPPRALKALNEFLDPPDDLGAVRSELQANRIPFLHYLAERAGLVGLMGECLKPTPLTHEWLAASADHRIRSLWEAWVERSDANRALWRRYRLPVLREDEDPLDRFHALLDGLSVCPPGPLGEPGDVLDVLARRHPALLRPQATYATWTALGGEEQKAFEADARQVLTKLLAGPLLWFGVLEEADESVDDHLVFTSLGAALLGREDGDWPVDPEPAPLKVEPLLDYDDERGAVILHVPTELPLPDRFALEAIVPPAPEAPGRYCLTRPRFQRALQRGHTTEGVVNFLERTSGKPLPAPVLGALYRWGEAFGAVTVRHAVLLQTREPTQMRQLTRRRRLRETLGATLNARTVEVKADRVEALLRRLEHRGLIPALGLPDLQPSSLSPTETEAERATVVAALKVYAHLADALGHPTRPAHALIRRWRESLSIGLRDAADRLAENIIEALHRADPLEMEDRLPQPTGPLLDSLEAAIEAGKTVEIDYYTAGRAHHTTRRVDPLRLEWHGDVIYLIAYCHLRRDQRSFRVDRIEHVGDEGRKDA